MELNMRFEIEQIAICPPDPAAALELLRAIGATFPVEDEVIALGKVFGVEGSNVADLYFDYNTSPILSEAAPLELEILNYKHGPNWMDLRQNADPHRVSHLGMHCSAADLVEWRKLFAERGIEVAQEVVTQSHTNEVIKDERRYNYVIFDTHAILGVDLKFIVRLNMDGSCHEAELEKIWSCYTSGQFDKGTLEWHERNTPGFAAFVKKRK
jgi:hypothetical protein